MSIVFFLSKGLNLSDPTSIELLAIQEACRIFYKSSWAKSCNLILECDFSLVVDWLLFPHLAPEVVKSIVSSCLKLSVCMYLLEYSIYSERVE
ncbi:hypothetical protein GQ457_12G010920 [Hibiscus cannabinus]